MKQELIRIITEFILGSIIIISMGLWILGGMAWANWHQNGTADSTHTYTATSHQQGTSA